MTIDDMVYGTIGGEGYMVGGIPADLDLVGTVQGVIHIDGNEYEIVMDKYINKKTSELFYQLVPGYYTISEKDG